MREDTPASSLAVEQVLANAPTAKTIYIKLRPVLE